MKKFYNVRVGKRSLKKAPFPKMKPGADSRLKKILQPLGYLKKGLLFLTLINSKRCPP
jgi:hypothetical protein